MKQTELSDKLMEPPEQERGIKRRSDESTLSLFLAVQLTTETVGLDFRTEAGSSEPVALGLKADGKLDVGRTRRKKKN